MKRNCPRNDTKRARKIKTQDSCCARVERVDKFSDPHFSGRLHLLRAREGRAGLRRRVSTARAARALLDASKFYRGVVVKVQYFARRAPAPQFNLKSKAKNVVSTTPYARLRKWLV